MDKFYLLNNVLLWLCLPLLPPALIGARIGVLVCVLVGVCTRSRVETIAHPLTVSAPPDPVGPELYWDIQPLVEIFWSTIPAKEVWEVTTTALRELVPDHGISIVEGWLQL